MNKKTVTPDLDTIGTATRVGNYDSNTPEWHALRKTGIGGSDVAAIVGLSPWASAFKVWAVKTGRLVDESTPSEAAEWGNILEPVILDQFAERTGLKLHRNVGTYANQERPWQLANPDALYELPDGRMGIVEVKTSRFEDDWVNGVPQYYQTQIQWYANTFGFDTTIYVVALFSGSKFRIYEVESDPFIQGAYLAEVEKFRHYLETDTKPDFDGSMSTLQTVREIHPNIDPEADEELGDLWIHYCNALTDEAEAVAKANEMKARVLDAMGNAKRGLYDDKWVVTRQSRNGGTPFLVVKKN